MSKWGRRLLRLAGRGDVERQMTEEVRLHLEMEEKELIARGLSPEEARRQAYLTFGGVERYKEQSREAFGTRALEDFGKDLRFAVRTLWRRRLSSSLLVATLGLGLGATVGIYGFVHAVLLRPLPYADAEGIVRIVQRYGDNEDGHISPSEHFDYERQLEDFSAYGSYTFGTVTLAGDGDPLRLQAAWLSHGAIPAFGVSPVLGRTFSQEEDLGDAHVAILGNALWRDRYGERADIVGQTVRIADTTFTVIGVMPASFVLPEDLVSGSRSDVLLPLGLRPEDWTGNRGSHFLEGVARLGAAMSQDQARHTVATVSAGWTETFPDDYSASMGFAATTRPIAQVVLGDVRQPLWTMLGAALLVLLLAGANVANLLLGTAESRRQEFAVRLSLGARRGRIIRQILAETLVLALLAGILGMVVAAGGTRLLLALDPPNIPRLDSAGLNFSVVWFGFGLSFVAGILFGLVPALSISARNLSRDLKNAGRAVSGGGRHRVRRLLVAAELAIGVLVLVGAGLFTRSFQRLMDTDTGLDADQVLTARISTPDSRYLEDDEITGFYRELTERLAGLPGVVAAGAIKNLPLATGLGDLNFRIEGHVVPEGQPSPRADWQTVTPGYKEAMGLTLVRGRWIGAEDVAGASGAVVIGETTAATYWPGGDPIGARFVLGGGAGPGTVTVVGIVRDVTHEGLDIQAKTQMYLPHEQFRGWNDGEAVRGMNLVLRTESDPLALVGQLRNTIREMDSQLPISDIESMEEVLSRSVSQPRTLMTLLVLFSLLSATLAAIGVYGVVANVVSSRTREFAIRKALGAQARQVIAPVLQRELKTVALGIAVGLLGALVVARTVASLLHGVPANDLLTLVSVPLGLAAVALLAAFVAAQRAVRIDPNIALRSE
ncbi:MAG: ABC transporter permease [Gemmatimonadota bacterium]